MRKLLIALSLLLVFTLLPVVPSGAAEYPPITGVGRWFADKGYYRNGKRVRGGLEDFENLSIIRPGDEIFLPLESWYFEWDTSDSDWPEMTAKVNQTLNLGVSAHIADGQEAFDSISIVARDNRLGLLIDFADSLASFEPLEFEANCHITQGGGEIPGGEFVISGEMRNREQLVTGTLRTVTLGKGRQAEGYHLQDLQGVAFDLGCGVTLTADLLIGQQVYAFAEDTPNAQNKAMMARYPQIERVVRIVTEGFGDGAITLHTEQKQYVYGAMLDYLGTTEAPLPLEAVYYLSKTKVG